MRIETRRSFSEVGFQSPVRAQSPSLDSSCVAVMGNTLGKVNLVIEKGTSVECYQSDTVLLAMKMEEDEGWVSVSAIQGSSCKPESLNLPFWESALLGQRNFHF